MNFINFVCVCEFVFVSLCLCNPWFMSISDVAVDDVMCKIRPRKSPITMAAHAQQLSYSSQYLTYSQQSPIKQEL